MDPPRFLIQASEAASMAESAAIPLPHFLLSLVSSSQSLARPPISNFPVAAVGLGPSGRIFVGVNLEFPGLPLHHSVHAEQFLLTNLSLNAEPRLDYFVVSAAPCGHCRQFLQEIRDAPNIKLLIASDETRDFTPLTKFLSHRFGPHDLLPEEVPLLLEPRHNGLSMSEETTHDLANGYIANEELKVAALEAANKSHAPYSGCPSGVALMDGRGKIYKGSYMESAAFNPSMGPVQAALVAFVAGGGGKYDEIVAAVLVEKEGATVKQEGTGRLLIESITPKCQFKALLCRNAA
ncbi:cytidine deaminase 1-like [Prosopis cineraria]|uniref:cytidine deaminase 1-like n=1 Tax=Prosopis cineraria TaxID=364024 RepID=UPI002410A064|nr:cytidine deaminase 1-like [Prosopis cineraria]